MLIRHFSWPMQKIYVRLTFLSILIKKLQSNDKYTKCILIIFWCFNHESNILYLCFCILRIVVNVKGNINSILWCSKINTLTFIQSLFKVIIMYNLTWIIVDVNFIANWIYQMKSIIHDKDTTCVVFLMTHFIQQNKLTL